MTLSYSKTSVSFRPHEKPTFSKLSTVRTVFENLRFLVPENAVYTEGKKGQKISFFQNYLETCGRGENLDTTTKS